MSLDRLGLKVLKNLTMLKRPAEKALQKARKLYERYFNYKVKHQLKLEIGDRFYIDKPTSLMKENPMR